MTTETKPAIASLPVDTAGEATYDRFAPAYRDWWAPVIAPAAVRLLERLDGLLPGEAPATLVDIGVGTGTLALAALRRWPQVRVIGIDPARRLLEFAEAEGGQPVWEPASPSQSARPLVCRWPTASSTAR